MLKDNFYKITIIVSALLLILIAVFVYLNSLQSPHVRNIEVRGGQFNSEYLNQRIKIKFSRPVQRESISNFIQVDPEVNYSLNFIQNDLQIIFNENLDSNQEYKVTISKDLKDIYNENFSQDYIFNFKTKEQGFTFIQKGINGGNDKVIESDLSLNNQQILYESEKIKYFSKSGEFLSVVLINSDKTQNLLLLQNGTVRKDFKFQNKSIISIDLISPDLLLYVVQNVEPRNNFLIPQKESEIYIYDIEKDESRVFSPKNTAFDVVFAKFSPDGSSVIYKSSDSFYYIADILNETDPIAIGRFQTFGGFNGDLNKIVFTEFDPLQSFSSFPFISIFSSDRQITNITDGKIYIQDPIFFNKTDNIIYSERLKELEGSAGIFKIINIVEGVKSDILVDDLHSLELPEISSDDRYLLIEKYSQLDLLDYNNQRDFFNYRKPLNANLVVYDLKEKRIIGEIENAIEGEWLE